MTEVQQKAFCSYLYSPWQQAPSKTNHSKYAAKLWDGAWLCILCSWCNFSFLFFDLQVSTMGESSLTEGSLEFPASCFAVSPFCMPPSETTLPMSLLTSSLKKTSSSKVLRFADTHTWMGSTPISGICSQWLSLSPHPCLNRSKKTQSSEPASPRSPYWGATGPLLPQLSSSAGSGVTTSPEEFQPTSLFFKASICECCSTWLTIKYGMQSRSTLRRLQEHKGPTTNLVSLGDGINSACMQYLMEPTKSTGQITLWN